MNEKVSLLITQGKLEEERKDAEWRFWNIAFRAHSEEGYTLIGVFMGVFGGLGSALLFLSKNGSEDMGKVLIFFALVSSLAIFLYEPIRRARHRAYRRWRYIRPSPYGQMILKLHVAIKRVERKERAGIIGAEESYKIIESLQLARSELWISAHKALGLVIDQPYSILQAETLLKEVTCMVAERNKALKELGLVV